MAESREEVQVVMELKGMVAWDLVTGCEEFVIAVYGGLYYTSWARTIVINRSPYTWPNKKG